MDVKTDINIQFAKDIDEGLSKENKTLPSKYFYNKKGDALFVEIMNSDEYYPTDCEMEIFSKQSDAITASLGFKNQPFNIVELGAGDGTKTIHLLKELVKNKSSFTYKPLDISAAAVENVTHFLNQHAAEVKVEGIVGDYFTTLKDNNTFGNQPKVILFIGSNLGNMTEEKAISFLKSIADCMNVNDKLLLGLDLKKDPKIILAAYNDRGGNTAAFNLNLLDRINNELGGNFNRKQFMHWPVYEPDTGKAKSYIVSKCKQTVFISSINKSYKFDAYEAIHTEISQKYDYKMVSRITKKAGLKIKNEFTDNKNYFIDLILEKL